MYHKSDSVIGTASAGVSNVTGPPKIWDSTFCVQVDQASNHAFISGLICLSGESVMAYLPARERIPKQSRERRDAHSRAPASQYTNALHRPPLQQGRMGFLETTERFRASGRLNPATREASEELKAQRRKRLPAAVFRASGAPRWDREG